MGKTAGDLPCERFPDQRPKAEIPTVLAAQCLPYVRVDQSAVRGRINELGRETKCCC